MRRGAGKRSSLQAAAACERAAAYGLLSRQMPGSRYQYIGYLCATAETAKVLFPNDPVDAACYGAELLKHYEKVIVALAEQTKIDSVRVGLWRAAEDIVRKYKFRPATLKRSDGIWRVIDDLACAAYNAGEAERVQICVLAWSLCELTGWPRSEWPVFA